MTKDIHSAIVTQNFEIAMLRRQPAIKDLFHLDAPLNQQETPRCFLAPVTAVAFDMNCIQRIHHIPTCLFTRVHYSNNNRRFKA